MYRSVLVVRFWRGAGIECYYTVCIDSFGEEGGERGEEWGRRGKSREEGKEGGRVGKKGEEWGRRGKSGEEGGEERGAVLLMPSAQTAFRGGAYLDHAHSWFASGAISAMLAKL